MCPKFRGDSDDWLDDDAETGRRSSAAGSKSREKARPLPPEKANGTVAEVFPKVCRVRLDGNKDDALCSYRRAAVIGTRAGEVRERSPVAVGDRVAVTVSSPGHGVIEGVCERSNFLSRPAPGEGEASKLHVIAANLDLLLIVASAAKPDFSPGLVDRFLVAAQAAGIPALICVNKGDLLDRKPGDAAPWDTYRKLGLDVEVVSAMQGSGVPGLKERLQGKRTAFCGHSGVGKTSLLRALTERELGAIGGVSELTGKGRHTTSSAVLVEGGGNSEWIDTPGVREFGLHNVTTGNLARFFPEFAHLDCRTPSCRHYNEDGCVAPELARHPSYLRIFSSLLEREGG